MKEFDLNSVWKDSDEKASEYFSTIEPKILEMATKKSQSIAAKLKRKILIEWAAALGLITYIFIQYADTPLLPWLIIATIVIFIINWIPYGKLLKSMKEAPTENILKSTEIQVGVMDSFIKRLKLYTALLMPLGFLLGLFLKIDIKGEVEGIPWEFILTLLGIGIVLCTLITLATFKWYIPAIYGKTRDEYAELLKDLKES